MKRFNTTGVCVPEKHYMVDIEPKVRRIRKMVDDGLYFTINRAHQYGKTTTLTSLRKNLSDKYVVLSLDFQGIGNSGFSTEESFVQSFCRLVKRKKSTIIDMPRQIEKKFEEYVAVGSVNAKFGEFGMRISIR